RRAAHHTLRWGPVPCLQPSRLEQPEHTKRPRYTALGGHPNGRARGPQISLDTASEPRWTHHFHRRNDILRSPHRRSLVSSTVSSYPWPSAPLARNNF